MMSDRPPVCTNCGYPTHGLEHTTCPECGSGASAGPGNGSPHALSAALSIALHPRAAMLAWLWREDPPAARAWVNIGLASVFVAAAVVWAWLVDPMQGALASPLSGATFLFQLVFVLALAFTILGAAALVFEQAAVMTIAKMMHVTRARLIAWHISSVSTSAVVLGGAATLLLVAIVRLTGMEGLLADGLPAGGLLAGMLAWIRTVFAGLGVADVLREAAL